MADKFFKDREAITEGQFYGAILAYPKKFGRLDVSTVTMSYDSDYAKRLYYEIEEALGTGSPMDTDAFNRDMMKELPATAILLCGV